MSKILFSEDQIDELFKNPNVKNVTQKAITYTDEFKQIAVDTYLGGETPRKIFQDNGFEIAVVGIRRAQKSLQRWREMSHRDDGFTDMRHVNSKGRPRSKPRNSEEEVAYLKDKLEYLKQENEFLKKLRTAERQAMWASQLKSNTKSFTK